jgi:alkylation response protein AidB-like acyl-CoA dehydrogenase
MAANPKSLPTASSLRAMAALLTDAAPGQVERLARALIAEGFDQLPLPGSGRTHERWRCLAAVAAVDLALAKIFESHTDALAIRAELGAPRSIDEALHAVWAAEGPQATLEVVGRDPAPDRKVTLKGVKPWCSGASFVDTALVTTRDRDGRRWLAEVSLRQAGVTIDASGWHAVGMRATATATVTFDGANAVLIGGPGAYLDRPGFWHGGAGIAACWYGAAAEVATRVRALQAGRDDPHANAKLGTIDGRLAAARALLREVAATIDGAPRSDARHDVMRARTLVASTAEQVLQDAAFAIGPGPLTGDERIAHLFADLPVFVRQIRGGHDLVAQVQALPLESESPWAL